MSGSSAGERLPAAAARIFHLRVSDSASIAARCSTGSRKTVKSVRALPFRREIRLSQMAEARLRVEGGVSGGRRRAA
jgi:hypothetical protein